MLCFHNAVFIKDKIVVSYSGGTSIENHLPTKFLVFDLEGNYIKTLETGYQITHFCYDKTNNRIIMALDDAEIQFAYLNMVDIF